MSTIALDRDERLDALFLPVRDMSTLMGAVVAGSIVVHAILIVTAFIGGRAPLETPKEIAVEVVQEVPKPPSPPKPEPVKPQPVKPTAVSKPAPMTRAELPKPAPPNSTPPNSTPPKPAPPTPKPLSPPPAAPRPSPTDAALQKELESLRAEQAALKSQLAAASPAVKSDKTQDASGKALALAAANDEGSDPVGYQQIVFSQLAKAKDSTSFHGGVGTAAVRFEIAVTGTLAWVQIVTPSGDADLDREALAIVRRAAPFPPPPKEADRFVFANVNFIPPKRP